MVSVSCCFAGVLGVVVDGWWRREVEEGGEDAQLQQSWWPDAV